MEGLDLGNDLLELEETSGTCKPNTDKKNIDGRTQTIGQQRDEPGGQHRTSDVMIISIVYIERHMLLFTMNRHLSPSLCTVTESDDCLDLRKADWSWRGGPELEGRTSWRGGLKLEGRTN